MPYKYKSPINVLSPKDNVSDVEPIFDNGNFHGAYSVAKLKWNNKDVVGVRWNITENEASDPSKKSGKKVCVGEPNSRGHSTWFILPDHFLSTLISNSDKDLIKKLSKYLEEKKDDNRNK